MADRWMRHSVKKILISVFCWLAIAAVPSQADVLVTRDGSRIETQGPWEVKGRQVLFTLPNGTLSAMRASEVDLDASRAATDYVAPEPVEEAAPVEVAEPVLVLTNKDLPEVVQGSPDGESGAEDNGLKKPVSREPVQVVSWKRVESGLNLEIRGVLRNTGRTIAASVSLEVQVKDEEGEITETAQAFIKNRSLVAGQNTTFRAVLADTFDFSGEPIFNISSTGLTLGGSSFSAGERAFEDNGGDGSSAAGAAGSAGAGGSSGGADGAIPEAAESGGTESGGPVDNPGSAGSSSPAAPTGPAYEEPEAEERSVDANG